jgi:hypothetical protein
MFIFIEQEKGQSNCSAMDLIENQARIVKFCVKINNFDHWCIEASEFVDLMMDLVRRDEKYLLRDGLTTPEDSLHRISRLKSQYMNFVSVSMFETGKWQCFPNLEARPTRSLSSSTTTTSSHTTPTPSYTTYKRVRTTGATLPPPHNRLGFGTGIPQVGKSEPARVPAHTAPIAGTGTHHTRFHTVLYETHGTSGTRGLYTSIPLYNLAQ